MYFSKLRISAAAKDDRRLWRALGDVHAFHSLIWELFSDGPDRRRDFLYRLEQGPGSGSQVVYTVSARPPLGGSGLWEIVTKPYDPQVSKGQPFLFSLRVNPVISRRDENGRQHRHDVVMHAKRELREAGREIPPQARLVQEAATAWLQARAPKAGFAVDAERLRVDGYRQQRWLKSRGRHPVSISTVDFTGLLSVTDPEAFRQALFKGIGPAKGFGNGLLLIKRP